MTSLGLSLKLSPQAIASLSSSRVGGEVTSESDAFHEEESDNESNSFQLALPAEEEEDWDDTMPVPVNYLQDLDGEEDLNATNIKDEDSVVSESSELSRTPPPSLPVLLVNLERLCGFTPSSIQEAEQLRLQVVQALSQDDVSDDGCGSEEQQQEEYDDLARHFDSRVAELFDTQVANHSDTSQVDPSDDQKNPSCCIVEYPDFLCRSDADDGTPRVLVTARAWKQLLQSSHIPVIDRLFTHLRNGNKPLLWKYDIYNEVLAIVKREEAFRNHVEEQSQLQHWKLSRRKDQLDKLYQVRETFSHRLDAAMEKLQVLEEEREDEMKRELRKLRQTSGEGGLESLDFDTNIFSFGLDGRTMNAGNVGNDIDMNDEYDAAYGSGYENEDDEDDGDSSLDEPDLLEHDESCDLVDAQETLTLTPPLPPTNAQDKKERSRSRRKTSRKTQRNRLQAQQEAAKEQARIEQAWQEEERVREACATPELKVAQATVASLEEKMQQVDNLLESLQEEEWVDEEEGVLHETKRVNHVQADSTTPRYDSPLLDTLLAAILGALPQSDDTTEEEHYKFLRTEHENLFNEWKEHFGRLPSVDVEGTDSDNVSLEAGEQVEQSVPLTDHTKHGVLQTADQLRESFGIVDNVDLDNWEDDVNDDLEATQPLMADTKTSTKPPTTGLRPGGRVTLT